MNIVDLSMPIREGMQTFAAPWHPYVEITQMGRHGLEDRETRKIVMGTHTGTHMDAPRHFVPGGATVDQIDLDLLIGPASLLDFSEAPDFSQVDRQELAAAVGMRPVERIILRFDWDVRALGTRRYYTDHPFLSEEACRWLVERGCRLLAMDTPQPDDPKNCRGAAKDAPNHKILLGNHVILVEYLVNLAALTSPIPALYVAPLRIVEGDGAPVRCFAIEEE